MTEVLYFVAGAVFILFIVPIMQQLVALAGSLMEILEARLTINLKVYQRESKIPDQEPVRAIGFGVPSNDDDEDDYEDD